MAPRTREELLSSGVMDPKFSEEITKHPLRDPQPSDPYYGRDDFFAVRDHRAARLRERHHLRYVPGPIPEDVREEDRKITVRDGAEITVRIYTPGRTPAGGSPLIVLYHEGGWAMGDLTDEEVNARLFTRELGAVCVNVDYRLYPENQWPTHINDSWDALQWASANSCRFSRYARLTYPKAASNAASLGADPTLGFVVGGGSAGGNISAVLAHIARDEKLSPPLTGQYLCVPAITVLMNREDVPEEYQAEYLSHPAVTPSLDPVLVLPAEEPRGVWMSLVDFHSPLVVPWLYREKENGHTGLPPAYFQVCGLDPLRDEGLIYERVLREEAGVKTRLDLYPGVGHYFWTNFPLLEKSRQFVEDTVKGMRWLLEQKS